LSSDGDNDNADLRPSKVSTSSFTSSSMPAAVSSDDADYVLTGAIQPNHWENNYSLVWCGKIIFTAKPFIFAYMELLVFILGFLVAFVFSKRFR
jgi:hypothetical protein